jgi:hypothetical protein
MPVYPGARPTPFPLFPHKVIGHELWKSVKRTAVSFAKAIQLIKGGSSKWVHEEFPRLKDFGWQDGYAAFSVSRSQCDKTAEYINKQKEHHLKRSFEEEFIELLDKHGIEYDARYVCR